MEVPFRIYTCSLRPHLISTIIVISIVRYSYGGQVDTTCTSQASDCVCSMEKAQEDMQQYFSQYSNVMLEEKLRSYECTSFERLPKSLFIDASQVMFPPAWFEGDQLQRHNNPATHHKPGYAGPVSDLRYARKRRRYKRQVLLGVPTNEAFNEAIAIIKPNSFHQYVLLGSATAFSCTGPSGFEEGIFARPSRFIWSHYDGKPVTAPMTSVDPAGTLSFHSVQLLDTGIYNCNFEYYDEYGQISSRNFSHQLSVISEPIFSLPFKLHYKTDSCSREEKFVIGANLERWVHELICPICQVHNPSIHCVSARNELLNVETSGPGFELVEYEIQLVLSLLGLDLKFGKSSTPGSQYANLMSCTVSCLELYQARLMELMSYGNDPESSVYHVPVPESLEMNLLLGCLAGFHLSYKLCSPCDPGHFSPEGSSSCSGCPVGQYQPLPGSSSCISCDENYSTAAAGTISQSNCILAPEAGLLAWLIKYLPIILIIIALIVLIIVILICIRCFCPKTGAGRCVSGYCCCCCPAKEHYGYEESAATEDIQMRKSRKKDKRFSKARYTKLGNENELSRSKRETRIRNDASNDVKFKGNAVQEQDAEEDEDTESSESEDDENETAIEVQSGRGTQKSSEVGQNGTTNEVEPASAKRNDRLRLHRCMKRSAPYKAVLRPTFGGAAVPPHKQVHIQKSTIPKPPPMPNFSYG